MFRRASSAIYRLAFLLHAQNMPLSTTMARMNDRVDEFAPWLRSAITKEDDRRSQQNEHHVVLHLIEILPAHSSCAFAAQPVFARESPR
jgi:hypothetical protein